MKPVSARFLSAVTGSHHMLVTARVVAPGQVGLSPVGIDIAVLGGDVTMDATADIRATLDLTTDGTGMWPAVVSDLLAPYGNELYVSRGIRHTDGSEEMVGLGYFRIQGPDQDVAPNGPIRLSGRDRMAGIVEARLLAPREFGRLATYADVVDDLVREVYPQAVVEWDDDSGDAYLGRTLVAEEDRFAFVRDLVISRGKVMAFDQRGVLVIITPPDPGTPVFTVAHGPGGVLVRLSRTLTRDGVYNAVVASGEATDTQAPVRAVAVDDDPVSPTYFHGPFGPVPRYFTSPFITTVGQAQIAAESLLRRALGLPYQVDFTAVPNPALEPYDPVRVTYDDGVPAETHVLESVTIGLTADAPMTARTREQTVVLIGLP